MDRKTAAELLRAELNKHGLQEWHVRLNQNPESHFLGLCSHKDKCIILSAHHIDIHPDPDVVNTIRHEVAHALTPGHGHDDVWSSKAKEIGCDNTLPCSNLSLSPEIINAIRSGADVEVTFDEHVIRTPKYNITRLQDKCEKCGKVARMVSEKIVKVPGDTNPDMKFISLECGHLVIRKIPKGTPFHLFQKGGDKTCTHKWNKNKCVKCGRFKPYDFQLEGMKFIEAGLAVNHGAATFDEMGLGKTIQAGAVVYFHKEYTPTLWCVKSGAKYQTSSFILNWMPGHIPQVINGSKDYLIPGLKHYIVSYDLLVPKVKVMKKSGKTVTSGFDIKKFEEVGIKCVILDECQQIKNVDSTRTQMVRRLVKNLNCKVIPLSGTPWNNRGSELFPILNILDPMKFADEERFKQTWVDFYYQGAFKKEGGIKPYKIAQFKEYIKDLAIRRERTEVMPELPLINRTKLNVVMTATEEEIYDEAVEEFVKWYEEQASDVGGMAIIAAMAKMRHLVAVAKVPATLEYVDEFIEDTDRKLVIFAHHIDVQQMLHKELHDTYELKDDGSKTAFEKENGYNIPVLLYHAGLNAYERNELQDKFNSLKRVIMVASQGAAGESLNLQTCCDCVMHERQWNPGREEQCEGRFIRIGSIATSVNAIYTHLTGLTTTDPQLDGIVERKRLQFHDLHNKGEGTRWNEDSIMKELAEAIVNAHNIKKGRKKAS